MSKHVSPVRTLPAQLAEFDAEIAYLTDVLPYDGASDELHPLRETLQLTKVYEWRDELLNAM